MDIKVTGPKGPQKTDKKKNANRSGKADGPSFASLVEAASTEGVESTQSANAVTGVTAQTHYQTPVGEESVPQEPKEHGAYLLKQLEELERDILSGSPTQAVQRLKNALEQSPLDSATLTEKQRTILDALHLRAAVEVAKIEEA